MIGGAAAQQAGPAAAARAPDAARAVSVLEWYFQLAVTGTLSLTCLPAAIASWMLASMYKSEAPL